MHEFEALLFADCGRFASAVGQPDVANAMQSILDQFTDPEAINDSKETAPSKRILKLVPEYDKVAFATVGIQAIGLDAIRRRCPNFAQWVALLEDAAAT